MSPPWRVLYIIYQQVLYRTGKTTYKYGTRTAPSSSKLLRDRTVGSPIQVRSETYFHFWKYYVISCIDHTYSTPLHLRIAEKAKYGCSSCLSADSYTGEQTVLTQMFTVAAQSRIYRQFFLCRQILQYNECSVICWKIFLYSGPAHIYEPCLYVDACSAYSTRELIARTL